MGRRKLLGPEAFGELEWFRNEAIKAHPYFSEIVETMLDSDKKLWEQKESARSDRDSA
jgi:hypothetical protein